MKQFKRDLDSVLKTLNTLTERVKKMQSQLETAAPKTVTESAKKPSAPAKKAAAPKTAKGKTAYEMILEIIGRSKNGATTAQLKSKTGFNDKKIANLIFKARKQGKVKSEKKGLYIMA